MRYLVTADLHLHNFIAHSIYPNFRLDQFRWVSEWWSELVSYYDLDAILVGGDFFHVSTPAPEVLGLAIEFVNKLPCPVVIVHGQHDLDARSQLQHDKVKSQSLLQILPYIRSDVHYLHHEWITIGDDKIYGFGWHPDHEWPSLDHQADILLSHGSVKGARFGKIAASEGYDPRSMPGKIAFIGDIHQFQKVDNIYIPGPPIHHTFSDSSAGVVLYDSKSGALERLEAGYIGDKKQWKFLQLRLGDKDYFDTENRIFYRKRRNDIVKEDWKIQLDRTNWDLQEQLQQHLPEELKSLHFQLFSQLPQKVQNPDLNFQLTRLVVHNFRSISDAEITFNGERVWLLTGNNGAGKSSFLEALRYALLGARTGAEFVRKNAEEMYVILELYYNGNHYKIQRGYNSKNYLKIWCEEQELDSASLRNKEQKLEEIFPWIPWLDQLGIFTQFRLGLMAPLSQRERLEWVAKIFGLDLVQNLYNLALSERSKIKARLETCLNQLKRLKPNEELLQRLEASWPSGLELSEEEVTRLNEQLHQLRTHFKQEQQTYHLITAQIRSSKTKVTELQNILTHLQDEICPLCRQPVKKEIKRELLEDHTQKLSKELQKIQQLKSGAGLLETKLSELESQISQLEQESKQKSSYLQLANEIQTMREAMQSWKATQIELETELSTHQLQLSQVERYITYVSPKSPILHQVMEAISQQLSEEDWQIKTYRIKRSGELEPDFSLLRKVGEHYIDYDSLSGGQRIIADLYLLKKILQLLGGIGFIAFDETFRTLDRQSRSEIMDWLNSLPARNLWIISHDAEVPDYDLLLQFQLNHHGITEIGGTT